MHYALRIDNKINQATCIRQNGIAGVNLLLGGIGNEQRLRTRFIYC